MDERIKKRVERAIEERVFPGCVIGIVRADGSKTVLPIGTLRYETEEEQGGTSAIYRTSAREPSIRVNERTIYDLASITKSIPTASLALMVIEQEKLELSDAVRTYIPELQNDYGATIEDLLTYRVHGPQLSAIKVATFEELRTHIFEHGLDGPPGKSLYTNLPAFLLGIVIERVTGEMLPALAHRYFFQPLQMHDTTFFPVSPYPQISSGRREYGDMRMSEEVNIAPTEIVEGKEIRGIVHDESARLFASRRRAVGHAGLFSTAPDLLNFLEAVLNVGHRMSYIVEGAQKGLGWQVDDPRFMGEHSSQKTFGKTGFTGTSVVCDVERGVGFVILSNCTHPQRPANREDLNNLRSDIADIVFAAQE